MNTVRDADGKALFEQGFLVDVTERKESENLFRAVFDGAFEAMVISNDEGRYVDANPAACEVFGRTHDELVGMRVGSVSGTPEQAGTTWRSLLEEGAVRGPYDVVRPDGTVLAAASGCGWFEPALQVHVTLAPEVRATWSPSRSSPPPT